MLIESLAIVLHKIKYDDKNLIVHVYSRDFGRISYIAAKRKKQGSVHASAFEALSLIRYQAEHKPNRELQRMKECQHIYAFHTLFLDPVKNSISLFLSEVLYRVLQEAEANESLFAYLSESIKILDLVEDGKANFHIAFLMQLCRDLGITPNMEDAQAGWYFDMQAGCFVPFPPNHKFWMSYEEAGPFIHLQDIAFDNLADYRFSRIQRRKLLDTLLDYYRLHLNNFPLIKSLDIMQDLFEG